MKVIPIEKKEPPIPVLFRVFPKDGSIIAIFPTLPGDMNPDTCSSFMHVGQHSACTPHALVRRTFPCPDARSRELRRELESEPYKYKLTVISRISPKMDRMRRAALYAFMEAI